MSLIIKCGFKPVNTTIFRSKTLNKGKKLVESHHVSDVYELKTDISCMIKGTVLRETPGALSNKTNTNTYKPTIEVDSDRNILDTDCTCKGGKGFCKHAAAICIYVNEENTVSKTDVPMTWNRPPTIQLERYQKGTEIENLWPSAKANKENVSYVYTDVINVIPDHLMENVMQSQVMQAELKCMAEKEARLAEERKKEATAMELLTTLYALQQNNFRQYTVMVSSVTFSEEDDRNTPIKIKITALKNCTENECFNKNLSVDEKQWLEIALKSAGQSGSSLWFKERFVRITASNRAHRIKTRVCNFEALAESFATEQYKAYCNIAMRYGLEMEGVARNEFQKLSNCIVQEVGLIICSKQPFLACSPDGIINKGNRFELLEIKCPYICEKTMIVNTDEQVSLVPYLEFDENGIIQLKRNHIYYTQVQICLYVLNINICNFFVYSPKDFVNIVINKDEAFLSLLIPKVEHFYFHYFFPLIQSKFATIDK